jgi:hypothetical protein
LQQQILEDRQSYHDSKVEYENFIRGNIAEEAKQTSSRGFEENRRLSQQVDSLNASNTSLSHEVFEMKKLLQASEASYSDKMSVALSKIKSLEEEVESFQNDVKNEEATAELKRLLHLSNPAAGSSRPEPKFGSGSEFYQMDSDKDEPAGGGSRPSFFPTGIREEGIFTPAISHPDPAEFRRGKQVDEKIDIKPWPSISGFRAWKLAFKKAVAAASRHSKDAFAWITQADNAKTFEELENNGDLEELDAKLAVELDKILSGEFRKSVQIKEAEYSREGKMVNGRQITWNDLPKFQVVRYRWCYARVGGAPFS